MIRVTEKLLDKAFEAKIKDSQEFRSWLLGKTKFSGRQAKLILSRSDNPWYRCKETGKDSETDILLVFEDFATRDRFALHFENKRSNGKFGERQPELYHKRANDWLHMPKWGSYRDFEVIIIAPIFFYRNNSERSAIFHRFISHEAIAEFVPEFRY